MKYYRKVPKVRKKYFISVLLILITTCVFLFKNQIYRQVTVVNLPVFYLKILNFGADFKYFMSNKRLDEVKIMMSPNDLVKLQKERSYMVSNYILNGTQWLNGNEYYKVKCAINSTSSKGKIKIFGLNPDHYRDPSGHSFRIKFNGKVGYGRKTVNYMNPRARDYITDVFANEFYNTLTGGIKISHHPVKVIFNKMDYGYYIEEDFFDKYLIEKNHRRESVIFEAINDSLDFNYIGLNDEFLALGNELNNLYINDNGAFLNLFDIEKVKALILTTLIINDGHPLLNTNIHWYYNPASGLIEPILREFNVVKHSIRDVDVKDYFLDNPILVSLFDTKIKNSISDYIYENLNVAVEVLEKDKDIALFEEKMLGFSRLTQSKKRIIKDNINFLKSNLSSRNLVKNDTVNDLIVISRDTIIKEDLLIKNNQTLVINPGVNVNVEGVYLRVLGGLKILGKMDERVRVFGSESMPGTIYISSKSDVNIEFADFVYMTNANSSYDQPASITFYETDSIYISNSTFEYNVSGDDYVNFFRCQNVTVKDSYFKNVLSDAIDSDFSNLTIDNVVFENIGNDAVDGSGSNAMIVNSRFINVKDKAVSAGENSFFEVKGSSFLDNEIALVAKDESYLLCSSNTLVRNRMDLAAFRKKRIFDYPRVTINNTLILNYLVESNVKIDGIDEVSFSREVESKLYGNLYGKASK